MKAKLQICVKIQGESWRDQRLFDLRSTLPIFSPPILFTLCTILLVSLWAALPAQSKESLVKSNQQITKSALKPVLSPQKYFGRAALGYAAAKKVPDVCSRLFCYCGCDLTDLHTSLLDCFTCEHGVDCAICQDEAIIALHMKQEGKSIAQIQKSIDEAFSSQYPWQKPSAALLKYRASLGNSSSLLLPTKPFPTKDSATYIPNTPRSKASKGSCCGHHS